MVDVTPDAHVAAHHNNSVTEHSHNRRALRKARKLRKTVMSMVAVASLGVLTTAGSAVATGMHTVTLNVDGVTQQVSGWSSTVNDVLSIADVETSIHDVVIPAPTSYVSSGQTITVQHAHEVSIVDAKGRQGQEWAVGQTIHDMANNVAAKKAGSQLIVRRGGPEEFPLTDSDRTVIVKRGDTVKDVPVDAGQSVNRALDDADMSAGPLDQVTATPGKEGKLQLTVERVEREDVTQTVTIERPVKEVEDPSLYKGQEEVKVPGADGTKVVRYAVEKRDGKEVRRVMISEKVVAEPKEETKHVGTKALPAGLSPQDMVAGAPPNPSAAQAVARTMLADFGFDDSEFGCLVNLWSRESGWRYNAGNPSSGAYGIPQALPASKMASAGSDYRTNPATQIKWGLGYIKNRYGTPCSAWGHSRSHNWY